MRIESMVEEAGSGKWSEPQDEYISGEKSGKEPTGLYWIGRDENGQKKTEEIGVGNTDRADREIEKLKKKEQELKRQQF